MWINPLRATLIVAGVMVSGLYASEGIDDVVRLQRAGVSTDVQLAFVKNAPVAYDPSSAELESMEKEGVSASVMVAMIDHGKEVRAEPTASVPSTSAAPGSVGSPSPSVNPVTNPAPRPIGDSVEASVTIAPDADDTNISFFYEAMSPHGKWHQHPQYGWVFQPTVVVERSDWRPYVDDGRWVWTDQGWYWQSDVEWGWAPFHYGRWAHDDSLTWVWVPDNTWGPAWVNWRQSEEVYGWAPLPPETRFEAGVGFSFRGKHVDVDFNFGLGERDYAFIPAHSFFERDYRRVELPREKVVTVYKQTTIINNTYVYNNNRIVNNGIPRERVERVTNRKVETVTIREERAETGRPIPRERQSGNEIAVFRPQVKAAAPVTPPAAIERREKAQEERKAKVEARTDKREQNQEQRTQTEAAAKTGLEQEKAARATKNQQETQSREQAQEKAKTEREQKTDAREEAAKQRVEQEKAQRTQNVDAREKAQEQAKAEREQSAAAREQAAKQRVDQEKAARERAVDNRQQTQEKAKTEREDAVKERAAAQEKAKAEREQNVNAKEEAAKQRVEQEKAQRTQEVQEREKAQEQAKAQREQKTDAREDAAKQRVEQEKAQRAQETQAREKAADQRQQEAQQKQTERKQEVQEKQADRKQDAAEKRADKADKNDDKRDKK